jgi:hypothetical protein
MAVGAVVRLQGMQHLLPSLQQSQTMEALILGLSMLHLREFIHYNLDQDYNNSFDLMR